MREDDQMQERKQKKRREFTQDQEQYFTTYSIVQNLRHLCKLFKAILISVKICFVC